MQSHAGSARSSGLPSALCTNPAGSTVTPIHGVGREVGFKISRLEVSSDKEKVHSYTIVLRINGILCTMHYVGKHEEHRDEEGMSCLLRKLAPWNGRGQLSSGRDGGHAQ